jgi:hypothetical protein
MVLPSAPNQISFNDIRIELNVPSQTSFTLRSASLGLYGAIQECETPTPDTATPDAISEWYGYNHSATASLVYNFTAEYTASSCADACELLDGENDTQLIAYTRDSNIYFKNATCTQELSPVGFYAVDRTTCYTVTATSVTTSACNVTTTTTTTTTQVQGTCYKVENGNNITPTLDWTSVTGQASSGSVALNGIYYICSIVTPTERGGPAELTISSCSPPDSCTNNCTTITCKSCFYTC